MKVEKEFYDVFASYYSPAEIAMSIADGSMGPLQTGGITQADASDPYDSLYKITISVELIPK